MSTKHLISAVLVLLLFFTASCGQVQKDQDNISTDFTKPFGKGVFIWKFWDLPKLFDDEKIIKFVREYENDIPTYSESLDLQSLIGRLKNASVNWVAIKLGDYDSFWLRERSSISNWLVAQSISFKEAFLLFHEADIAVYGWQFLYNFPRWDTGNDEAWCSRRIIESGVDGFIADAEFLYELRIDPDILVKEYFDKIKKSNDYNKIMIGYTSFAEVDVHARIPYSEYAKECSYFFPQNYWVDRDPNCETFIDPKTEIILTKKLFEDYHKNNGFHFTKNDFMGQELTLGR